MIRNRLWFDVSVVFICKVVYITLFDSNFFAINTNTLLSFSWLFLCPFVLVYLFESFLCIHWKSWSLTYLVLTSKRMKKGFFGTCKSEKENNRFFFPSILHLHFVFTSDLFLSPSSQELWSDVCLHCQLLFMRNTTNRYIMGRRM